MKKQKMNGLYKAAFILLLVCVLLFAAAIVTAYLLDEIYLSAVFSGGGVLLALVGIILASYSKPKRDKTEQAEDEKSSENG